MMMSAPLAPPLLGGSGTISIATWNIRSSIPYPSKVRYFPHYGSQIDMLISIFRKPPGNTLPPTPTWMWGFVAVCSCVMRVVNARESAELIRPLVFRIIILINYLS
jgi:hypothetical protein